MRSRPAQASPNLHLQLLRIGVPVLLAITLSVFAVGPDGGASLRDWVQLFLALLGGLALFPGGLQLLSEGMKKAAGQTLKTALAKLKRWSDLPHSLRGLTTSGPRSAQSRTLRVTSRRPCCAQIDVAGNSVGSRGCSPVRLHGRPAIAASTRPKPILSCSRRRFLRSRLSRRSS